MSVITNVIFNQQEKSRNEVTSRLRQQKSDYRYWYCQYFWQKVSVSISAILFESIVNNPANHMQAFQLVVWHTELKSTTDYAIRNIKLGLLLEPLIQHLETGDN